MPSDLALPKLEVRGVTHVFEGVSGTQTVALENINLRFNPGEFVCILGPSGCGKTTLFNIIAGLQLPSEGQVLVDGIDVTGQSGVLGYQLQKDLLLPWRTVVDNVILGLEIHGMPKKDARQKVLPPDSCPG